MPSQVHRRRPAVSATLDPRLCLEARELGKVMGWTMSEVLDEGMRLFITRHGGKAGRGAPLPPSAALPEGEQGGGHTPRTPNP